MMNKKKICVLGMGYVGLPLSVALSNYYEVFGYDYNNERISQLQKGLDKNRIITKDDLLSQSINFTSKEDCIQNSNIIIVTVPTPVNSDNTPDVSYLEKASRTIGQQFSYIKKRSFRPIVLFESTTFPGCTEEICVPIIEEFSSLKC